jgi:hypothetical protein
MIFDDFTDYDDCEPAGVELPHTPVDEDVLNELGLDANSSNKEIMYELARKGLRDKGIVNYENKEEYFNRTKYELDILDELGFTDYILLNWDILNYCHKNNIPTGAGRGCFTPDSLVTLYDGSKKEIKNVKIGDIVLDHENNPQKVIDTLNYEIDEDILEIEFKDGRIVRCTSDHEFYTENRGWIKACSLNEEDDIREIHADPRPKPV